MGVGMDRHPPVGFRLAEPVLEGDSFSKALARHFLLFSLLAKASK